MKPFSVGDNVRLTRRFAKVLMVARKNFDYLNRRGVVAKVTSATVFVRWEGLKSADPLPFKAVEKA